MVEMSPALTDSGPIRPLIDEDVGTPLPPMALRETGMQEITEGQTTSASTFTRLTAQPTEPAGSVVSGASKGTQKAPATSSAATDGGSSEAQVTHQTQSIVEDLLSATIAENTSRANIPAIKQDVRTIATHMERELQAYAAKQTSLQATMLQLTDIVSNLRPSTATAPVPGPTRVLQDRVEQLAQHFERLDDQRGAELDELRDRSNSLQDDTTIIIQGVGKLTALVHDLRGDVAGLRHSVALVSAAHPVATTAPVATPAPAVPPVPLTPVTPPRPRSPSPRPGPATPRQYGNKGRHYTGSSDRPPKRPRPLPALRSPSPPLVLHTTPGPIVQPHANSAVVRFGSIVWSPQTDLLKREVRASARGAWDALPGAFDSLLSITLDGRDATYVLLTFPSPPLARAFLDAWAQNKHTTQATQKARAEIV
ncbi:hypothetical protein GY45DRAFT_1330367 [Cubamyces sp. BRFM 1775]|nr:hypothetical protein GY45DRAFT_1330367 [Cubamyces sp. BRFM 1775]